jgi:triphosphoribosyl-dephospho-CoA synthase
VPVSRSMPLTRAEIAAAFEGACLDELRALKPGNAHIFSDTHKLSVAQFEASAKAAAPGLTMPGARVGARILAAVKATQAAVATNTNLGIVLLCAPLAASVERLENRSPAALQAALSRTLGSLDIDDTSLAFRAITKASPGGLGDDAHNDVRAPARLPLKAVMASAAARDRIAWQYAHDFSDIFARGLAACVEADARPDPAWRDPQWRTLLVYLDFLGAIADTHILRRHDAAAAERTREAAAAMAARLRSAHDPTRLTADLTAWDAALKAQGVNPGTSADLTVATLFVRRLSGAD